MQKYVLSACVLLFMFSLCVLPEATMQTSPPKQTNILIKKIFDIPFSKENNLTLAFYKDSKSPKNKKTQLGLFDSNSHLIQSLTLIPYKFSEINQDEHTIQSVELIDFNLDGKKDFILNFNSNNDDYEQTLESFFFINSGDTFIQSSLSLAKNTYEIQAPFIKVYTSLTNYKDPYLNHEHEEKWMDFYHFKDGNLTLANHLHKKYFTNTLKKTEKKLGLLMKKIHDYKPQTNNIEDSQLELNELFQKLIYNKILAEKIKVFLNQSKK